MIFSSNLHHMILVFGFDPMVIYPCAHNSSLDCVKFDAFVIFSMLLNLILDTNFVIFCNFVKFDS